MSPKSSRSSITTIETGPSRARRVFLGACSVLWAALLLAPAGSAGQDESLAESSTQASRPPVRLVEESPCCPKEIVVEAPDPENEAAPQILRLSARIEEIDRLLPVVGDQLLVAGTMRYGGEALILADLRRRRREQVIWTHGWTLSPSGQFLVYRTHHPRMVPAGGRRSILLLWDLTKPPSENIQGEPSDWPTPNLGRVIYPQENRERNSYDVRIAPSWYLGSDFLWSEDEPRLVFLVTELLDEHLEERECSIVRLDLAADGSVEAIEQAPLLPTLVTFRGRPRPGVVVPNESLCFYATKLSWADEEPGQPPRVVAELDELSASDLGPSLVIEVP